MTYRLCVDLCSKITRTSWTAWLYQRHMHWSLLLWVWWLLKELFVWAYMMIKPSSLIKELLTALMLPFLSRWTSLSRESPFRHKVVYSVDDGCSLQQKSIHHERENTMLFVSIFVVNCRPFLRCSIVWWQICWTDYQTLFEELMSENKCQYFCIERKLMWLVLKIYFFPVLHLLIKCLVTKLRMNQNAHQVLFLYVNAIEKWTGMKKYWIKNTRERSNLCLCQIFILLQS